MKLSEQIKHEIIDSLKPFEPDKVILFGSYAWGNPNEDSDIDIYIVTQDDFIPSTFKEKLDLKVKISKAIAPIREKYPVDIIVHTRPMFRKFAELGSSFATEILT